MGIFSKRKNEDFFTQLEDDVIEEISNSTRKFEPKDAPNAITVDELNSGESLKNNRSEVKSPLEALKNRMKNSISAEEKAEQSEKNITKIPPIQDDDEKQGSLLEKCKAYTVDDQGNDFSLDSHPLYKLESVAEILKSDGAKALDSIAEKYGIKSEDVPNKEKSIEEKNVKKESKPEPKTAVTVHNEQDKAEARDSKIYEEFLKAPVEIIEMQSGMPDISDIDNVQKSNSDINGVSPDTSTIRFTPVKDSNEDTAHITVSSLTKPIDMRSELQDANLSTAEVKHQTKLERNEFEEFSVKHEYKSFDETKKFTRKLALKNRSAFLRLFGTFITVIAMLVFLITPLRDMLVTDIKAAITVCASFFALSLIFNYDAFLNLKNIFNKKCSGDSLLVIFSLCILLLSALEAFIEEAEYSSNTYYIILLGTLIMLSRAYFNFKRSSYMLSNFKQIATTKPKKAVTLITDSATTFAMAKNSIDGDVMAASPRNADFIEDYMKYSRFGMMMSGRMPIITVASCVLALALGIISNLYYSSTVASVYCLCCIMCISCLPCLFFIDVLPLHSASKKLNKKGAMIAGKAGAWQLETANAAVISSQDFFPSGTITLQDLKILSESNVDDILMRAASLTEAVGSPLSPIFKQIAKTNSAYTIPDSDTVKYEERLGLSGWVDNELLFIGNRTLMEAHGITVPSIEVDHHILHKGYFPVYLASGGNACALLVIQYNVMPEIAHELQKVTGLGVTLLISNCDPNINEEMICDYFGLYSDSVKIISNAGVHMYKNAVTPVKSCSAPAAFRTSAMTFIYIMNCASRIKKSNAVLSVVYAVAAALGIVSFIYISLFSSSGIPDAVTVILYSVVTSIVSFLLYLIKKP